MILHFARRFRQTEIIYLLINRVGIELIEVK